MKKETFEKAKSILNKINILETKLTVGVSYNPATKEDTDFDEVVDRVMSLTNKACYRIKNAEIIKLQKEFDNLK